MRENYERKRNKKKKEERGKTEIFVHSQSLRGSIVVIPTGAGFDQLVVSAADHLHILQAPIERLLCFLKEAAYRCCRPPGRFRCLFECLTAFNFAMF